MSLKKKEDMEKYKGLLIFNICIFISASLRAAFFYLLI